MEVPKELTELRQWIVWRDEDGRKIPYQVTGAKAKSNDPATWSSLEEAKAVASQYSGLGFVFAEGGGLWGMDLDGCRDPQTGLLSEWAECILNELGTYAEVSPSGTGVKLWGRGTVGNGRKISVDEPKVASKAPGIEVYDRGRYFTFTGQRVGTNEIRTGNPLAILKAYETPVQILPATDVRPKAYIDNVPGASEGGRNQTAFRLSACLLNDFALCDLDAWPLLCSWNDRNTPPLTETELKSCFASAGRNAKKPRGSKLNEPCYDPPKVAAPEVPDEPLESVPGLIGDIVEHNLRTAMYPQPELALAGALTLLAVITGRKVADQNGTRTNLYTLGVAPSGAGKEHARQINKDILLNADAAGEKMIGPERIGSHSGLVTAVEAQPAILFQIDEMGKLLATMRNASKQPHLYNIGSVLLQLYSSAGSFWVGDAYADAKKVKRIRCPHACIYGTSTPGDFWDSLTAENVSEGLLGRLLVFEGGYVPKQRKALSTLPESVLDRVRYWLGFNPGGGNLSESVFVARYTGLAERRLEEHLDGICERRAKESTVSAAVWSRAGEKTAKLALLFACSRADGAVAPVVDLEDVNRAIRIVNLLTRRMLRKAFEHVADNETEHKSKKLLRKIDGELTLNELTRRTQWLRNRERQEILADLQACGYIQMEPRDTGGRPVTWIKRINDGSDAKTKAHSEKTNVFSLIDTNSDPSMALDVTKGNLSSLATRD